MLGHQAGDDIGFIIAGDGNKSIHIDYTFQCQQIKVKAVSLYNQCVMQLFGQFAGGVGIGLNDLDVVLLFQRFGDQVTRLAAAPVS